MRSSTAWKRGRREQQCKRLSKNLPSNWRRPRYNLRGSVADRPQPPRIYVLAGVNGARKSSIGGAMFREAGIELFNPDAAARTFLSAELRINQQDGNAAACEQGRRALENAIEVGQDFSF